MTQVHSLDGAPPVEQPLRSLEARVVGHVSQEKLMENLQSKTPYKFKKTYGGTPEPQTPQDAPWLRGPSLKL
jgi:hypothetical protein